MQNEIVILAIILLALLFLATVDTAFAHLSDIGLRRMSADETFAETSSAKFLREILDNRPRFKFALSSSIQVLLIGFTVLLTVIIANYGDSHGHILLISLVLAMGVTVLSRQIIPRFLVQNNPERKLLLLLPAIRPVYRFVSFFVDPIAGRSSSRSMQRLERTVSPDALGDRDEDNSEDLQALMEVGEAEGIIEEDERELIETLVEFGETRTSEIMTPRTEIVALSAEATVRDARDLIVEQKYSRLPVYRETIDNVEGILYVRDLIQAWAAGLEDGPIIDLVRDAFFVPETKTANELLKSMQRDHVQIAIVIDEYGGVAGLVTVEDIVEEIVGEIEDEDIDDEEIVEIVEGEDGYYDVAGSTEIDKIERIFDLDLENADYTTVAGLVTSDAGYVPKVGEVVEFEGLSFEVLDADEKKVRSIRIRRMPEPANAPGGPEA